MNGTCPVGREAKVLWAILGAALVATPVVGITIIAVRGRGSGSGTCAQPSYSKPTTPSEQLQADCYSVSATHPTGSSLFGCTRYAYSESQSTGYGQAVYQCSGVRVAALNPGGTIANALVVVTGELPQGM